MPTNKPRGPSKKTQIRVDLDLSDMKYLAESLEMVEEQLRGLAKITSIELELEVGETTVTARHNGAVLDHRIGCAMSARDWILHPIRTYYINRIYKDAKKEHNDKEFACKYW